MPNKYKIILVDDHCLFRDTLKFVLLQLENIEVIAEASNGLEFLELIDKMMPDLVLMDISMPVLDGIEATRRAIAKYPGIRIIALSMFGGEEYYQKMLQAGVKGFVLKESGSDELINAINTVISGEYYFSREILNEMVCTISSKREHNAGAGQDQKLSKREIQILSLICNGLSNNEIADKLSISQRTVEGHRSNIIHKTESKNPIHLVLYAVRNNLVEI